MTKELRLGIAGLGTVGVGVIRILEEKRTLFTQRSGTSLRVTAISARSRDKDRGIDLSRYDWVDNPVDLASHAEVDVVIEVMGGSSGAAYDLCKQALTQGKHVVTANKALIAHHGTELATIAESNNVTLAFEAAVAGGIPILKSLKEGLAANDFEHITGILNGTCNYILTTMEETEKDFDVVLAEAQEKGYAEADPSFDIDGVDAAHKLSIIAALAYGGKVNFADMYIEGIRSITLHDIHNAEELGYKIKLFGTCRLTDKGLEQRVHPCLVDAHYPLAKVDGVFNAVLAQCDNAGKAMAEGRGAGERPTASSVLADVIDIATDRASLPFNVPISQLTEHAIVPMNDIENAYYLRLSVVDEPGVLADITRILSNESISMKSFLQKQNNNHTTEYTDVVITTHPTLERAMNNALVAIKTLNTVVKDPYIIRIIAL